MDTILPALWKASPLKGRATGMAFTGLIVRTVVRKFSGNGEEDKEGS